MLKAEGRQVFAACWQELFVFAVKFEHKKTPHLKGMAF